MAVKNFLQIVSDGRLGELLLEAISFLITRPLLLVDVVFWIIAMAYWILALNVFTQDWFFSDSERLYRIERAVSGRPASRIPDEVGIKHSKKALNFTLIACLLFLCDCIWVGCSEYLTRPSEDAANAPSVVASPTAPAVAPSVRPARKARKSRKALRPAIVPVESPKP